MITRRRSSSKRRTTKSDEIKFDGVATEILPEEDEEQDKGALNELLVPELRKLCKSKGLLSGGRKAELVARLMESMGVSPGDAEPLASKSSGKDKLYPSVAVSDAFNTLGHGAAAVLALRSASPGAEAA